MQVVPRRSQFLENARAAHPRATSGCQDFSGRGFTIERRQADSRPGRIDFPLTMEQGKHLFPFRTEKLRPASPMVLAARVAGRVGRQRGLLQNAFDYFDQRRFCFGTFRAAVELRTRLSCLKVMDWNGQKEIEVVESALGPAENDPSDPF